MIDIHKLLFTQINMFSDLYDFVTDLSLAFVSLYSQFFGCYISIFQ